MSPATPATKSPARASSAKERACSASRSCWPSWRARSRNCWPDRPRNHSKRCPVSTAVAPCPPVLEGSASMRPSRPAFRPGSGWPATSPAGWTVLVVEDEKRVGVVVREFLRLTGHTVLEASHVDEAIELCRAHGGPIDLLLTDVVMPGMDGPALASRLRSICPNLEVLYMTGYPDDILARHGVTPGGAPLIRKPFTVQA